MECEFGPKTQAYKEGLKFIVDPEDYDKYVKPYKFHANRQKFGNSVYIDVRRNVRETNKNIIISRDIMGVLDKKHIIVDHINRNRLDNRRSNLRLCSHQENMMNQGKAQSNKSGYKCVYWAMNEQKYRSKFRYNGKWYSVGYFDDPKEAHEEYVKKLKEVTKESEFMCTGL
jgi:hypothetical protein